MNRLVTFLLFISVVSIGAQPLILHNADYNRNSFVNGQLVSVLRGNVEFEYKDARIKGNKATWYRRDGRILFVGNVEVEMKHQLLTCKRMELNKNKKILTVTKNVDFYDSDEMTRFTGDKGVYYIDDKDLILTGKPLITKYDTVANDTLTISGKKMVYKDTIGVAYVYKNVKIVKGDLTAYCDTADYETETGFSRLRKDPKIYYDVNELEGDSVNLEFLDGKLRGIIVMRNAEAVHKDVTIDDTLYTKMMGDSVYMSIMEEGGIDTVWTMKKAATLYYSSLTPEIINRADGKIMIVDFSEGKTGNLRVKGNAESIYYIEDDKSNGVNRASGDEILIHFLDGRASYLRLKGGARGVYTGETL